MTEQNGSFSQTVYLDTEYLLILHRTLTMEVDDEPLEMTYRLRDVEFNPAVDDDRFQFDPPEDVTIEEPTFDREVFESRDVLAGAANTTVPDPEIPDGFDLLQATRTVTDNGTSVSLRYRSDTAALFVSKHQEDVSFVDGDGEPVTVGTTTGRYSEFGNRGIVRWSCDDDGYIVSGTASRETLLAVADSIAC